MNLHYNLNPFKNWVWQDRENRLSILLTLIISIIAFVWLKVLYPFPNFLPDSYSYLEAAYNNQSINIWPIGYSMFLRLFSSFTRSDTALVFAQYILLQASLLYFLFTLRYWLSPSKRTFRIILICCVANPLSPLISNFIASDALFTALSLIWLGQLLTISLRPSRNLLIRHAAVLVLAIMVRYNALYYPLVSIVCIGLTALPLKTKLIGYVAILVLVGGSIGQSIYHYRKTTGTAQFAAFGGWQLASNALYAYAYSSHPDAVNLLPSTFQPLQRLVNHHMDSIKRLTVRPDKELGTYYLWDEKAPLKQYLVQKWAKDSTTDFFTRWASMGPLYAAYGSWLIRHHPINYIRHFLGPNIIRYYTPDAEFMLTYNMGKDSIDEIARFWFHYKTRKIHSTAKELPIANTFPITLALINLSFVFSFLGFLWLGGYHDTNIPFRRVLLLTSIIWLANMAFSVLASPIVLRYQLFPLTFTLAFTVLLLAYIVRKSISSKPTQSLTNQNETYHQPVAVS